MPMANLPNDEEERLNERLREVREEYADEERTAADEEIAEREALERASQVYSVRLSPDIYDAIRAEAERAHLTPSALIRQWISERLEPAEGDDMQAAVAALRREVERVAQLARPA